MQKLGTTPDGHTIVAIPPDAFDGLMGQIEHIKDQADDLLYKLAAVRLAALDRSIVTFGRDDQVPAEPSGLPGASAGEGIECKPTRKKTTRKKAANEKTVRMPAAGKTSRMPIIVDILSEAAEPMSIDAVAQEFFKRTNQKPSTRERNKIGIALASAKNRFQRVGDGIYISIDDPQPAGNPGNDALLEADPEDLSIAELQDRIRIRGERGENTNLDRQAMLNKIDARDGK